MKANNCQKDEKTALKAASKEALAKTKAYLKSALKLGCYIEQMQSRLSDMRASSLRGNTPSALGVKVSSSPGGVEDFYCAILLLEGTIKKRLLEFKALYEEIFGQISKIDDVTLRLILQMRYLEGLKWDEMEMELAISKRHLFRLHDKALESMVEILKQGGKL